MKLYRLMIILYCMTFSYSLTSRHDGSFLPVVDRQHYEKVVVQFEQLIDSIATISYNNNIQTYKNLLNLQSQQNIAQQYGYLCTIVDWSLKDCKMMHSMEHSVVLEKKLRTLTPNNTINGPQLIAMQRHNRAQVKEIISYLSHVSGSICLQTALQDLYHALHEVKKQIATIDKASAVSAWYIYVMMLYVDLILMQAIIYLELSMHNKVEQQAFMHQFCCITERFTQTIRSNFMI